MVALDALLGEQESHGGEEADPVIQRPTSGCLVHWVSGNLQSGRRD